MPDIGFHSVQAEREKTFPAIERGVRPIDLDSCVSDS